MYIKTLLTTALLLGALGNCHTFSQTTIDRKHNSMRIGDAVKKYKIKTNDIWNLSHYEKCSDALSESFEDFKTDTITSLFNGTRKYYVFNSESLLFVGSENPQNKESAYLPETSCIFPMTLGNNFSGYFADHVRYCDKEMFHKYGTYTVHADSIGSLKLPNDDIVNNVLQICHERKYVYDQLDSAASVVLPIYDNTEIMQKLAERTDVYTEIEKELYVKGYRYPVVRDFVLYNSENEICMKETYFSPLDEEEGILLDEANMLARNQNVEELNVDTNDNENFSSFVSQNIDTKEVILDLGKYVAAHQFSGTMQCRLLLSDNQGVIYQAKDFSMDSSSKGETGVSYSGLKPGQYIISFIINNQTYTSNFIFE